MITPTDSHTATLLPDGQVLVAGGSTSGCFYGGTSGAELYNPATGSWAATGSMTTARVDQSATLLGNGKVLVTGGMGTAIPSSLSSAKVYNQPGRRHLGRHRQDDQRPRRPVRDPARQWRGADRRRIQ